ncbi:hypothetical protein RB595_006537 [Gaeumannomyces hyphopodioides]
MAEWLIFPSGDAAKLERRLPPVTPAGCGSGRVPAWAEEPEGAPAAPPPTSGKNTTPATRPFVTLTFATSLDSSLALAPGVRTAISGPESKAMTHFLRSRHDAILVGAGTAVADDPGLNCRLAASPSGGARRPEHQPRPVVVDPRGRWHFSGDSKVMRLVDSGAGLAPFVIITPDALREVPTERRAVLQRRGGKYIVLGQDQVQSHAAGAEGPNTGVLDWSSILTAIYAEGIRSLMIEGGGGVINTLLGSQRNRALVDSVIITIAPTWLGPGGVVVSPGRELDPNGVPSPALRLADVSWHQLGDDMVLCGDMGC